MALTGGWSESKLSSHESASESDDLAVAALSLVFFLWIALPLCLPVSAGLTGLLADFNFLGLSAAGAARGLG